MLLPECVWLTRHAETAAPEVFHGAESDIGLSELGYRQAAAAAEWFRGLSPTGVVSSGMRRARDTAGPIAQACGVPHLIEPDLHERRVGILGGQSRRTAKGLWDDTVREWSSGNTAFRTPGAESFDEIAARVLPAWGRVTATHPNGRVVVVAHGMVCKVLLLSLLEEWNPGRWEELGRVANLSVSELHPSGDRWRTGRLLELPPPVSALTDGIPTGLGPTR